MAYLLHKMIFVTVYNKFSKIQPPTAMQFAALVRRSRVIRLRLFSRLFMWAAASKINPAICLVYPPSNLTINLQEPCVLYIGRAYRYRPDVAFYI
jgi:hypothetical protein